MSIETDTAARTAPLTIAPSQHPPLGECDYCGLRMAYSKVGDSLCCHRCASSRVERIRACAERLRRHAPDVEPEAAPEPEVVDVWEMDEP